MTSNLYLRRFTGAASPLALGVALAMTANPAAAQSTTPPAPSPVVTGDASQATAAAAPVADPATTPAVDPNADSSVVVVRGFRAALQSAVNKKKNSDQVVESVSAEDIGKLPDASIGESIARLPGIASQRTNGRASGIAVRGFGPDFSTTLLNGREQTSTNDARGVEFDQYPSEIVSRVDVYKTPSAALVGQGLVGTIDIRTARPLDYSKPVVAIGARASYDDIGKRAGFPKYGKRFNGTFIDQFADKRVGIAISASYLDETYPNQQFNAWGYSGSGTSGDPYVIGGSKSYVSTTRLKRYGINGTLQFKPTDTVTITADGFYSHFNDDGNLKGIELPLAFGGGFNTTGPVNTTVSNNVIVSGTFPTVYGVVRNDIFQRKAKLYSGGLNLTWNPGNGWAGFIDYGRSRTRRNELSLESYSGTGYGNNAADPSDRIGFTSTETGTTFTHVLNYSDPNLIRLTDPLGWGGSTIQAGYYNNRIVKDDLAQYRAEVSHEYNNFFNRLRLGFNFTDRNKSLTPDEAFISLPAGQTSAVVPSQYLQTPTNLDYLGLGPIISYDARQLLAAGVLRFLPNNSQDIPAKAFNVKERLAIPYVQVDLKGEFGSAEVTGNIGVQAVHTDQSSSGLFFVAGNSTAQFRKLGAKYLDVLPSANLSLRYPGGQVIRLGLAREIQRPRLDDLREALSYGVDTNPANCPTAASSCYSGGGGNPYLRPYRANALDLTFEQYFAGSKGYAALQLYYKDVSSYISDGKIVYDFTGLPAPTGVLPGTSTVGYLSGKANTSGGGMYGAELAATLPFTVFTNYLDGFGFTGGVGYTHTRVRDQNGNISQIPGYSKWVANGTLFFEKWGFNARGSVRYRSSFLGDFTGFGGSPTRRTALGETIIDAQVGYDFGEGSMLKGLSLYLQGQNLTDERFESVANTANPLTVIDHQTYGRRYLAGFTYKF
ncbi:MULTISPECIES: TonB-dependent receptor [Sphingomonas]|uniref:TonB-dependent receptor n=1 Tax=Sphingomonas TaxID=13687 RepID=UPI001F084752|nr:MULTISPECIES: TonB-dependent receptor [Sphingomonas]